MQHLPKERIKSWPKSAQKHKNDGDSTSSPRSNPGTCTNGKRARTGQLNRRAATAADQGSVHDRDIAAMLIAGIADEDCEPASRAPSRVVGAAVKPSPEAELDIEKGMEEVGPRTRLPVSQSRQAVAYY